jgi:hypothetical protein
MTICLTANIRHRIVEYSYWWSCLDYYIFSTVDEIVSYLSIGFIETWERTFGYDQKMLTGLSVSEYMIYICRKIHWEERNSKMGSAHEVFIFHDDYRSSSLSSSLSSVELENSGSMAASVTKFRKVPDGIRCDCVCHRSNDRNQINDAMWLQQPMNRFPARQSHHQSNISFLVNRIVGWYVNRFTWADWVGT